MQSDRKFEPCQRNLGNDEHARYIEPCSAYRSKKGLPELSPAKPVVCPQAHSKRHVNNSEQQNENHEQLKVRNISFYCTLRWTEESSEPENRLGFKAEKVTEYQPKHCCRDTEH